MKPRDFLEFGMAINKTEDYKLPVLERDLNQQPDEADRRILQEALQNRRMGGLLLPEEGRDLLFDLCQRWNTLGRPHEEAEKRRKAYESFLAGQIELNEATTNNRTVRQFHERLQHLAHADEPHSLILALLRVHEATRQYCEPNSLGQKLPAESWRRDKSLKTYWRLDRSTDSV